MVIRHILWMLVSIVCVCYAADVTNVSRIDTISIIDATFGHRFVVGSDTVPHYRLVEHEAFAGFLEENAEAKNQYEWGISVGRFGAVCYLIGPALLLEEGIRYAITGKVNKWILGAGAAIWIVVPIPLGMWADKHVTNVVRLYNRDERSSIPPPTLSPASE